jgi:hypothetical protein
MRAKRGQLEDGADEPGAWPLIRGIAPTVTASVVTPTNGVPIADRNPRRGSLARIVSADTTSGARERPIRSADLLLGPQYRTSRQNDVRGRESARTERHLGSLGSVALKVERPRPALPA